MERAAADIRQTPYSVKIDMPKRWGFDVPDGKLDVLAPDNSAEPWQVVFHPHQSGAEPARPGAILTSYLHPDMPDSPEAIRDWWIRRYMSGPHRPSDPQPPVST